ncbi:MAG: hypothetical protein KJ736_11580 [Candidatus Omnitrophica bacterium]|nr:hypothetical protein [Candidatus Omnitrophota bacterium]
MKKIKLSLFLLLISFLYASLSFAYGKKKDAVEWKEYKKQHFIIYYKNAPLDFVQTVEEAAEDCYKQIVKDLGFLGNKSWTWDDRAKIYIYDDQDDYVKNSNQMSWSAGSAHAKTRLIKTYPTASGFFDTLLPHELGHIIFAEFVGPRAQIPRWFDEGVAMYQEKAKRFGSEAIVKKAIEDGTFVSIKGLLIFPLNNKTSREKVELYYAEAASIVYFMIKEHGQSKFVRFCRKLKEGGTFELSLRSVYVRFRNYDDLNKAWVDYLKR